jgi:hypothetical protein
MRLLHLPDLPRMVQALIWVWSSWNPFTFNTQLQWFIQHIPPPLRCNWPTEDGRSCINNYSQLWVNPFHCQNFVLSAKTLTRWDAAQKTHSCLLSLYCHLFKTVPFQNDVAMPTQNGTEYEGIHPCNACWLTIMQHILFLTHYNLNMLSF